MKQDPEDSMMCFSFGVESLIFSSERSGGRSANLTCLCHLKFEDPFFERPSLPLLVGESTKNHIKHPKKLKYLAKKNRNPTLSGGKKQGVSETNSF